MDARGPRNGIIAVAACALLWSTGGLFIKLVDWHPMAIAGARSLIAGLIILLAVKRPRFTFSLPQILAALCHAATMILFVTATKSTTAANAVLLQYTAPIYVAILGWALLREKPAAHHWIALTAVLVGMVLFFRDELAPGHLSGNLIALCSGITFALFSLFMRKQKSGSPLESLLLSNIVTALVGIPFYVTGPGDGRGFDIAAWAAIAALGIFQTGLSLLLFTYGIKRVTALTAMLIANLEPLLTPLWVFLAVGEAPGPWSITGGGIILVAVTVSSILSVRRSGRAPRE